MPSNGFILINVPHTHTHTHTHARARVCVCACVLVYVCMYGGGGRTIFGLYFEIHTHLKSTAFSVVDEEYYIGFRNSCYIFDSVSRISWFDAKVCEEKISQLAILAQKAKKPGAQPSQLYWSYAKLRCR